VGRFRRTRDREYGQAGARGGRRGVGNVHRRRPGGGLRLPSLFHSAFNTVSTCIASNGKMMARLRLGPHGRRGERRARRAVTGSAEFADKNNNEINGAPINTSGLPMVSAHREDLEAIAERGL
jgi:hypothetical protein